MSENNLKSWERPWTTQEMVENSSNWSLAGDAGLLKYLEEFSDKILNKTKETSDRLDDLGKSINDAHISLANVHNEFMGLHNTQFIESRVYEDDETLPTYVQPEKEVKPKQSDTERIEEIKQVILSGLQTIDEFYEKVEIPDSDSEDDIDEPSIVFQPVDKYADRPLPYIIGSTEWHKHWHVGLIESSSDSEVENINEEFSESESDQEIDNLPTRDRSQIPGISDSNSETDVIGEPTKFKNESGVFTNTDNMFESSSESESESLGVNISQTNRFAAELADKLGKVEQNEVNRKPIQKASFTGAILSDEPPPLDEDDNGKPVKSGLFSGGEGLFDDDDQDDIDNFWNPKPTIVKPQKSTKPADDIFAEENDDIFTVKKPEASKLTADIIKKPQSGGLFDDDDGDLFSPIQPKTAPIKQSMFTDQPPDFSEVLGALKKKPVGIKSPFGENKSLLSEVAQAVKQKDTQEQKPVKKPQDFSKKSKSPQVEQHQEEKTKISQTKEPEEKIETKPETKQKLLSLFDDAPLFSDDIFATNTKFTSNLFDDDSTSSLFGGEKTNKTEQKSSNLFATEDVSTAINKKQTLFSPDDDIFEKKEKTFDSSKSTAINIEQKTDAIKNNENVEERKLPSESLFSPEIVSVGKKNKPDSLFDSETEENNSLFATESKSLSKSDFSESYKTNDKSTLEKSESEKKSPTSNPLWPTEELSNSSKINETDIFDSPEDSDIFSYNSQMNSKNKSDIFDSPEKDTPPVLPTEEIKKSLTSDSVLPAKDDLFDTPEDIFTQFNSKNVKKNKVDIFDSPEKSDLFSGTVLPTEETSENKKKDITNIFDSPEKSNIFSRGSSVLPTEESSQKNKEDITNIFDSPEKSNIFSRGSSVLPTVETSHKNKDSTSIFDSPEKSDKFLPSPDLFKKNDDLVFKKEPLAPIFSSEPPPIDDTVTDNLSNDNDLFADVNKDMSIKSDNNSDSMHSENDLFGSSADGVNRKLSDGRLDLFADNFDSKTDGFSKGGLFDWVPPELDQPPPLKDSKERTEDKKSNSSLFSDEEDLFDTTTNSTYNKNSTWLDQEPPPLDNTKNKNKDKFSLFANEDDLFSTSDNLFAPKSNINKPKEDKPTSKSIIQPNEDKIQPKSQDVKLDKNKNDNNSERGNTSHPLFNDDSPLFDNTISITKDNGLPKSTTTLKDGFKDLKEKNTSKSDMLFTEEDNLFNTNSKKNTDVNSTQSNNEKVINKDKTNKNNASLFSDDDEQEKPSKKSVPKSNTSLFSEDSDEDLFSSNRNSSKSTKTAKKTKTVPTNSDNKSSAISSKIKHNLNINVSALLPGALPKIKKDISPEEKIEEKKVENIKSSDTSDLIVDNPIENVDTLTSATKQRVKGSVKRRPSTRRARQEAIRKSGIEFNIEDQTPESQTQSDIISPTETEKNIQNVANNNPSEKTDIFSENIQKSSSSKDTEKEDSLFDDSDMFKSNKVKTSTKKNLFDDDDDPDDDIFNNLASKPQSTNTGARSGVTNKKPASRIKKLTGHSTDIIDPLDVIK